MVCRDIFSTFTTASIVKTEQAECLLKGILTCITPIRTSTSVIIRTDSATGFQALSKNPKLTNLGIQLHTTDPSNKNSIASVDNAIKEIELELIKIAPHESSVNDYTLALALKSVLKPQSLQALYQTKPPNARIMLTSVT